MATTLWQQQQWLQQKQLEMVQAQHAQLATPHLQGMQYSCGCGCGCVGVGVWLLIFVDGKIDV